MENDEISARMAAAILAIPVNGRQAQPQQPPANTPTNDEGWLDFLLRPRFVRFLAWLTGLSLIALVLATFKWKGLFNSRPQSGDTGLNGDTGP
ncbi:hypothetical protein V8E51_009373 [Hyaloscypha variabilis]|jgi:hypothetical protein